MEDDNDRLDADVRLPPRKRLLAGLRRQNSDCPSPLAVFSVINKDMSDRLKNLFNTYANLSPEELIAASRSAFLRAAEVAAAAKALAEQKAVIAGNATAFAKAALEFVEASEKKNSRKETSRKRGRPKKQVPVNVLYNKRKVVENYDSDEELALTLHRAMNSSSRLLKSSTPSLKIQNYMKIRKRLTLGKTKLSRGRPPREIPFMSDKNADADDMVLGDILVKQNRKSPENAEIDHLEVNGDHANGNTEVNLMVQALEDKMRTARKRGRIKQKKLPLSLCTIRDRENSKEEPESRGLEVPKDKCTTANVPTVNVPENPVVPSAEGEVVSTWTFNDFNAPKCYAGSNILGSLCSNPTVTTGSAMVEVDQ